MIVIMIAGCDLAQNKNLYLRFSENNFTSDPVRKTSYIEHWVSIRLHSKVVFRDLCPKEATGMSSCQNT